MTAVMSSIGAIIIAGGLVTLIGFPLVDASGGEFGAFLAPFTPFTAVWFLVDPAALFNDPTRGFAAGAAAARTAAGIGSVVALGLYAFLVWRGYTALVRGFDMIMRKQSVS
jgi:hypothetical protein